MTSRRSAGPQKDDKTGSWGFVVDLGAGPDGRRRQARRRGFSTKREAQEALDKLRVSSREGTFVPPATMTVNAYLDTWLETLVTLGRSPSTIASYRRNLALHVRPIIGGIRLQALTGHDLDRLYARLLATGRRDGRGGLSHRTVRYISTIIGKAMADATRKRLVVRNITVDADPPSQKSARAPEMSWWTPAELATFLAQVRDEEALPLYRLAAMTGLRRGEVCGLRWKDVDLEAGRLVVRQQLTTVEHALVFRDHPKTSRGRRTVDLDPKTVSTLRVHRARKVTERLSVGSGFQDHGLVFAHPDGTPVHPEAAAKMFERRVARSGLPRIRFHDLRHTHTAHLIAAGQDAKVISTRLGHASVAFTYDRYGHLMPEADSAAALAVAALVDGSVG